jgi:hypothetical protein
LIFSQRPPDAHAAFRLPKELLATIDAVCDELDLTRSQLFRRSIAEYLKTRAYERDCEAIMTAGDNNSLKSVVRSVRFTPTFSELLKAECHARKVSLSEYVRQSVLANMRYMRSQAREAWRQ